jgi:putative hemolysin
MALAMTAEEVQEAQQLRYRAFCEELGARLETGEAGLDSDHFDPYCDTCWSGIPYETRRSPAPGS